MRCTAMGFFGKFSKRSRASNLNLNGSPESLSNEKEKTKAEKPATFPRLKRNPKSRKTKLRLENLPASASEDNITCSHFDDDPEPQSATTNGSTLTSKSLQVLRTHETLEPRESEEILTIPSIRVTLEDQQQQDQPPTPIEEKLDRLANHASNSKGDQARVVLGDVKRQLMAVIDEKQILLDQLHIASRESHKHKNAYDGLRGKYDELAMSHYDLQKELQDIRSLIGVHEPNDVQTLINDLNALNYDLEGFCSSLVKDVTELVQILQPGDSPRERGAASPLHRKVLEKSRLEVRPDSGRARSLSSLQTIFQKVVLRTLQKKVFEPFKAGIQMPAVEELCREVRSTSSQIQWSSWRSKTYTQLHLSTNTLDEFIDSLSKEIVEEILRNLEQTLTTRLNLNSAKADAIVEKCRECLRDGGKPGMVWIVQQALSIHERIRTTYASADFEPFLLGPDIPADARPSVMRLREEMPAWPVRAIIPVSFGLKSSVAPKELGGAPEVRFHTPCTVVVDNAPFIS